MLTTILLTLFLGVILGTLLLAFFLLWLIKIKCPQCQQLKPLREIVVFYPKDRTIGGKFCRQCSRPKPQIDISL